MPRLVSSYAANKRVEDGLKKKQEQIRHDYMKATHRHLDEKDKLMNELIQIHVRTPSAFQQTPVGSASSLSRRTGHMLSHQQNMYHPNHNGQPQHPTGLPPQHVVYQPFDHRPTLSRARSRGALNSDGGTDDGSFTHRKEIPLPIVQVRGKEVFCQYDNRPNHWKKVEPTYKTKVLLHRNNTVSQALKQFTQQAKTPGPDHEENNQTSTEDSRRESMASRKMSVASRRESMASRRDSMFSRRSSRRNSRFYQDDDDENEDDDRIPRIVELKPQLSPGHTPRSLDGFTIMNWCLWNKQQTKPVWASKRYIEKKKREYKRFQASRCVEKPDLPAKPASANASTREARRQSSIVDEEGRSQRAKSVPLRRNTTTIEEVDENDDMEEFPPAVEPDRSIVRPTTSILRSSHSRENILVDDKRPKTTSYQRRRVALDTFTEQDKQQAWDTKGKSAQFANDNSRDSNDMADIDNDNAGDEDDYSFREVPEDVLILRPKTIRKEGRTISINENPQMIPNAVKNESNTPTVGGKTYSVLEQPVDKKSLLDRMPGLAATYIAVREESQQSQSVQAAGNVPRPSQQIKIRETNPVLPKARALVPELGTDSPR